MINETIMKLSDAVNPDCLNASCRLTLHRHVLSHLFYLVLNARSEGTTSLTGVRIANFYRRVAVDLLALHGITDKNRVSSLSPAVAGCVSIFDFPSV